MNTQLVPDTREDLEQWLEGHISCESGWANAERWHPSEAQLRAYAECPSCAGHRVLLLCRNCVTYVSGVELRCRQCKHEGTSREFIYMVELL